MKKSLILLVLVFCVVPLTFGQIVTNGNQSAQYMRMMSRNASTDIDAVYYNPAGLTHLEDGFHLAIHNQTIFQEKTVESGYPLLNDATYIGEVKVPVFPNAYAVYKKDKFALSFGFGPNAGGGSADFANGLPSFEIPISGLPAMLSAMGLPTSAYSADIAFNGSSIFFGFQANASYAVSDMLSASVGFRYLQATNTYEGSIQNILINPMHPLINPTGDLISAVQFFTVAGLPQYAAMVGDAAVDVKQTGTAFQPILGLYFTPVEQLGISIRYEFAAKLELENDSTIDDTGMFPDGEVTRNDVPGLLALGLGYEITPQLKAILSGSFFFEKQADLGGAEELIDNNSFSAAIGIEYDLNEMITLSAGTEMSKVSVNDDYQSDLSHELSAQTIGFGGQVKFTPNLDLNLGGIFVIYQDSEISVVDPMVGSYMDKYTRTTWGFALGFGYHF